MKYPDYAQEIIALAETDQKMRKESQAGKQKFNKKIDVENTTRLKQIIEEIGNWPTISSVGEEASYAAWLIAQHADHDMNFQEKCLKLILESKDDVLPANIAYLTDRVAVNKGLSQIYGTQLYRTKTGKMTPKPIRDLKSIETKRQVMGLESFSLFKQKLKEGYKWPKNYQNPKIGRFDKAL